MSSAYQERLKCLRKLDSESKGFRQKRVLEKQNENADELIKMYKHFLETRYVNKGMDYRYVIQETEQKIADIKKESQAKLKKDLSGKVALLEGAKEDLKILEKTEKEYKKSIIKNKKLIESNTKKLKKIKKGTDKCYEKERKGETEKKRGRCPNGTRKNKKGNCEKK